MAVEREYILVYSINISRRDAVVMLKRQVASEIAGSVGAGYLFDHSVIVRYRVKTTISSSGISRASR